MADLGVKVEGLNLLVRNLRRVDRELPKGMKEIHQRIADPLAAKAKPKIRSRSGRLAGRVRAAATQRAARVQAGPLIYAPINHYGGYPGGYQGNPFLEETLAENREQVALTYAKEVDAFVEKMWESNF